MKLLNHIPAWLKNKYLISGLSFIAIFLFFDKNDYFTQRSRVKELNNLLESKAYYQQEIAAEQHELEQLKNNPGTLEKYAREKYLMKKDNEDLYIIPEIKAQKGK